MTHSTPTARFFFPASRRLLACTALALILGGTAGNAQAKPFSEIDTNRDRTVSFQELSAAFGNSGARSILDGSDIDDDDRLTLSEVQDNDDDDDQDDDQDDDGDSDSDSDSDSDGDD